MAKHDRVADPAVRERFERARSELAQGTSTEAVHSLSDLFITLLETKPEITQAKAEANAENLAREWTEVYSAELQWPRLGANLIRESVEAGEPKIEFVAEEFSMAEAMMYYEFTVDTALKYNV